MYSDSSSSSSVEYSSSSLSSSSSSIEYSSSSSSLEYSSGSSTSIDDYYIELSGWGTLGGFIQVDGTYFFDTYKENYKKTIGQCLAAIRPIEGGIYDGQFGGDIAANGISAFTTNRQLTYKPIDDPSWIWETVGGWPGPIGTIAKYHI